jgi:nitrogen-specific signal transduction histidine kinase
MALSARALGRHEIEVIREFAPASLPAIDVEMHKVLQIPVNLIRNAKYACLEADGEELEPGTFGTGREQLHIVPPGTVLGRGERVN